MVGDADDARLLEILRGANASPGDPDVVLADLLIDVSAGDEASKIEALKRLARDARRG